MNIEDKIIASGNEVLIDLNKMRHKHIEEQIKEWNNGYCTECGGKYKFTSVISMRKGGTHYYYTCDKCGKVIEEQELR